MWNACKLDNVSLHYVTSHLNIYAYDTINLYCVATIAVVDESLKCCIIDALTVEFFTRI